MASASALLKGAEPTRASFKAGRSEANERRGEREERERERERERGERERERVREREWERERERERERARARGVGGRVHDVTLELSSARTAVVSPERSLKSDAPSETQRYPGDLNRYSPPFAPGALSLSAWICSLLGLLPFFIPWRDAHEDVRRFCACRITRTQERLVKTR